MKDLLDHINRSNTLNLVELYKGSRVYGEVIRLLYFQIRNAVEVHADTLSITAETIRICKGGTELRQVVIAPFEKRATKTFRQAMLQILEFDPLVARYMRVKTQSDTEVICEFVDSSDLPSTSM